MKLLLSDEGIKDIIAPYRGKLTEADKKKPLFTLEKDVAEAQLKHIFNLNIKTTSELIVKLEARLDELYQKEVAK